MEKKSILIVGGSRGIGRATALTLAKQGAKLAISYQTNENSAQTLKSDVEKLGGICHILQGDLAVPTSMQGLVSQAEFLLRGLDGLVCCGGIAQNQLATKTKIHQWQRMIDTNLSGYFYAIQAALPRMIQEKKGSIVTLSSVWGQTGASCEVAYSTAKAGVIGMTKALAKEVGPSGIRVNCVAPGVIDTDMVSTLSDQDKQDLAEETPLCRIGTGEEVAETIAFLLSDQAGFITGQVLAPNGGFYC